MAGQLNLRVGESLLDAEPAQFEFGLVEVAEPSVLIVDHDVLPPRGGGLEIRASGLWAEVVVEELPSYGQGHVGVGLEAFGVAVDDPEDAWRGGPDHQFRGVRTPVGLDIGGESVGALVEGQWGVGVPCRFVGEVLIADRVVDFDGWGWWIVGEADSVAATALVRLDDGTWDWPDVGPTSWQIDGLVGRAPILGTGSEGVLSKIDRQFGSVVHADGRCGLGWIEEYVS